MFLRLLFREMNNSRFLKIDSLKLVVMLLCVLALIPYKLQARVFTDVNGKKIEATITKVEKDTVSLLLKSHGKEYDVPLARLKQADQRFVKEWAKKQSATEKSDSNKKTEAKHNFDEAWPDLVDVDLDIDIVIAEEDAEKNDLFITAQIMNSSVM